MATKVTAFISYSHEDRKYGAQAKSVLSEVGIEAFLAHEDLHVSDEWQKRILEGTETLRTVHPSSEQ